MGGRLREAWPDEKLGPRDLTLLRVTVRNLPGIGAVYGVELQKLAAQLQIRLLGLLCLLGPAAYAGALAAQSGTPSDALFGASVHTSGVAVSLVLASFAGAWGFPLVAGVIAGDLFAAEDRHGTWKTILTRSRSRSELFAGKLLAAASVMVALCLLMAASAIVAGLILAGAHPLTDLSGTEISALHSILLAAISWMLCLVPGLAYLGIAALCSVASRNGIVGTLGPLLVSLVTQLIDLIGNGVIVHLLLPGSGFDAWHGLFTAHPFFGPLLISVGVDLAWLTFTVGLSWRLIRRRDFASSTAVGTANGWVLALRAVLVVTAVVAVLGLTANLGPAGDTAARLRGSITRAFDTLTHYQQRLLGHPIPARARLSIIPNCNRHATRPVGPGDWSCTMNVFVLQRGHLPVTQTPVEYDVSVAYDGCYKAASPPAFVGGQTVRDRAGHTVANPLYVIYGCFNVV